MENPLLEMMLPRGDGGRSLRPHEKKPDFLGFVIGGLGGAGAGAGVGSSLIDESAAAIAGRGSRADLEAAAPSAVTGRRTFVRLPRPGRPG